MANHKIFATAAFFIAAGLALLPSVSSATALVLGIVLALTVGNPFAVWVKKATPWLFQVAIVGLGAGVDLATVGRAGLH